MTRLSENDPRPQDARGGPRLLLMLAVIAVIVIVVALHLTGVIGPGE